MVHSECLLPAIEHPLVLFGMLRLLRDRNHDITECLHMIGLCKSKYVKLLRSGNQRNLFARKTLYNIYLYATKYPTSMMVGNCRTKRYPWYVYFYFARRAKPECIVVRYRHNSTDSPVGIIWTLPGQTMVTSTMTLSPGWPKSRSWPFYPVLASVAALPPPGFETLSMVDMLRYHADHLDFCCVSTIVYLDLVLLCICRCVSATVYPLLCIRYCVSATVSTVLYIHYCICCCSSTTVYPLLCISHHVSTSVYIILCILNYIFIHTTVNM
jgi:hypothetical protein